MSVFTTSVITKARKRQVYIVMKEKSQYRHKILDKLQAGTFFIRLLVLKGPKTS